MTSLADAAAGGAPPAPGTDEQRVTAVRPDGVAVSLPRSSVPRALELGYQLENAEATALRKRHAEFATVGHELASAGLGAARGISFGTSDLALRASGLVAPATLRAYAEENPTASALGEAGGILGLPVAAAIGGTVGAAAGVAGAGVAAAGAVGEAAAGLAAKAAVKLGLGAADSLALDALGGVAQGAVRGAAEGSLYGLGQGVSNVAMRDEKDLGSPAAIGQVLLAHAGMGAVLGGAISGAVGGVTSLGLSGTRRVLRALAGGAAPDTVATAKAGAKVADAADVQVPDDLIAPKPSDPTPDVDAEAAPKPLAYADQKIAPNPETTAPGYTILGSNPDIDSKISSSLHDDHEIFEPSEGDDPIEVAANHHLIEQEKHGYKLKWNTKEHIEAYDYLAARTTLDNGASMIVSGKQSEHLVVPMLKKQIKAGDQFSVPFYLEGAVGDESHLMANGYAPGNKFLMHIEMPEGQHGIVLPNRSSVPGPQAMRWALPRGQQLEILDVQQGPEGMLVRARAHGKAKSVDLHPDAMANLQDSIGFQAEKHAEQLAEDAADAVPEIDTKQENDIVLNDGNIHVGPLSDDQVGVIVQHQHGKILMTDPAWFLTQEMRKGKLRPDVQAWRAQMDAVMRKAVVTEPLTVYRGSDTSSWAPDLKVGSTIGDPQFQSFTHSDEVADRFAHTNMSKHSSAEKGGQPTVFEIRMAKGDHALPISHLSPGHYKGEKEVLLPRDLTYRVTSIRKVDGYKARRVTVEIVPKQAAGTADFTVPLDDHVAPSRARAAGAAPSGAARLRDMALRVAGGTVANVASVTSGVDDAFMRKLLQPGPEAARMREIAVDGEQAITHHTRNIDKVLTHIEDNSHAVMTGTLGELKAARVRQLTKKGVFSEQMQAGADTIEKAQAFLQEYQGKQYAQGYKAGLRRLRVATDALGEKLQKIGDNPAAGGDVFIALDQYKRLVGQLARPGAGLSASEAPVVRAIRDDLYNGTLQPLLEDTALWGDAGTAQARINRQWVQLLDKKRQFNAAFLTEHGRDPSTEFWQTRQVADPAKVYEFLRNVTHVKNDLKRNILTDQITAASSFAKAAKDIYAFEGKTAASADAIIGSAETAQRTIAAAMEDAQVRNLGKQLAGTSTGRVLGILSKLDQAAGIGPEVRAELRAELRRAAGRMGTGGGDAQQVLDQLDRMHAEQVKQTELGNIGRILRTTIRAVGHLVDKSVGLTERAERVAIPVAISQAKRYALELPSDDRDDPNDRGAGAQLRRQLRALHRYTAQPSDLAERVGESTQGLAAVAPQTAAEVATAAGAAVTHLNGIAPRPTDYGLSPGLRADWQPTTTQAAAFSNALRAIMHPMSVPEDMAAGTLTRDGVQALAAVYPGLHDMIATMLAVRLQRAKSIPLQRRLQLSALWNLQTDAMVDPAFASMVQGSYPPQPPPRAAAGASYNSTDRTALRREVATPTQRIGA